MGQWAEEGGRPGPPSHRGVKVSVRIVTSWRYGIGLGERGSGSIKGKGIPRRKTDGEWAWRSSMPSI
ncbi:unnamed protein product [Arctogadus glacialis]